MVELKDSRHAKNTPIVHSFNRSMVELKGKFSVSAHGKQYSFNRSMVELKDSLHTPYLVRKFRFQSVYGRIESKIK